MEAPPLAAVLVVLALTGCLGAGDAVERAALAELPRTPENFLVLAEWETERVAARTVREFTFDVPDGLSFLDLDNHFRMDGGAYPEFRMFYRLPGGGEAAATSFGGSGVNGIRLADPAPGAWTLVIDGAENTRAFTASMWIYGCESGTTCKVPERPPEDRDHGH